MPTTPQAELIARDLGFPEGPVAMDDGSLIFVEMLARRVTRWWNGKTQTIAETGGGPNGAALGPDGALYVCNSGGVDFANRCHEQGPGAEGRLDRIDLVTGKIERVFDACDGVPLSAPNDLVFAVDGSLWFTDFGKIHDRAHDLSRLFHCHPGEGWIECVDGEAVSYNGVGLSPDGGTVYVADTFRARLYAFDATVRGAQNGRLLATVPGPVELDSLAVTAAGSICVGTLLQGGISSIRTQGGVTKPFASDEPYVTNIAFGGADMRDAYITLSTTGCIVRSRWDEPGLRLNFSS